MLILFACAWPSFPAVGQSIPSGPTAAPTSQSTVALPLRVVFFYSPTCAYCKEAKAALAACEKRYGPRIKVERYNVAKLENFVAMFPYEDHYGSKETEPPKVFVGRQYIAGGKQMEKRLDKVVGEELAAGSVTFVPPKEEASPTESQDAALGELLARFQRFGPGAVVVAGLVDGINPCAFTTIIFLLSMLALLGKSRHLILAATGMTAVAVFAGDARRAVHLLMTKIARSAVRFGSSSTSRAASVSSATR